MVNDYIQYFPFNAFCNIPVSQNSNLISAVQVVIIHSGPGRNEVGMTTKGHKETFHIAIRHAALFSFLSLFHPLFLLVSSIACFKPRHCNSNSNYTMD
jgi:hypothetical protein